jgi:hypothetical protein
LKKAICVGYGKPKRLKPPAGSASGQDDDLDCPGSARTGESSDCRTRDNTRQGA